ncbi:hypothetical protein [Methylobacter sp.]|uniref:hypothetical protein n=1 Tax=Methylobacter sp. TaxID=2051955 RepID=UPI0011FE2865|nr:hypothetical protein [Methylobacter sp.]TAK59555.1 MAG: hypothetical protein EPO18_20550 [Methylobacter sp.]
MSFEDEFKKQHCPQDANLVPAPPLIGTDLLGNMKPLRVIDNGDGTYTLYIAADLTVSDIQIGAVEIKDGDTNVRTKVKQSGGEYAVLITANELPLPAGAATEATLAALKARADLLATESTLAALKARADLLATEATLLLIQIKTDNLDVSLNTRASEVTLAALKARADLLATESTLAALKTRADLLLADSTFTGRINTLGQKAMVASTPVVLPSDQSAIPITKPGVVSTGNSSTALLAAAAVFTGAFEEVKDYAFLTLSVISDVASATDGLSFQWSHNGVDVDRTEMTSVLAGVGRAFAITPRARFFRVVYTNGAAPQVSFRLGVVYHLSGNGLITKPIKQTVTQENFAQLVQATILGHKSDGTYVQMHAESILGHDQILVAATNVEARLAEANQMFFTNGEVNIPTANVETPYMLIRNPAGSGKNIRLNDLRPIVANTGTVSGVIRIYARPTVTAVGTASPITSYRITASPPVSIMQSFTLPTISVNGTKFGHIFVGRGTNAFIDHIDFDLAPILEPGNDILITAQMDANNTVIGVMADWAEV